MLYTDPTGKYTCTGYESECKAYEMGQVILRAAAAELSRAGKVGATRLNDIVALYGKAGVANGVNVVFGKTQGILSTSVNPDTKVVTITVDRTKYSQLGSLFAGAVGQAHEGDHALTMRENPLLATSRSRSDLLGNETSAYRSQAYVNSALGIEDDRWHLWDKADGFSAFDITVAATQSVAADCGQFVTGCSP